MQFFKDNLKKGVLGLALMAAAFGAAALASPVSSMTKALFDAEKAGKPVPFLAKEFKKSEMSLAYEVQGKYVAQRLSTEKVAGYKGGLTAEALIRKFKGTEPVTGVLFQSGMLTGSPSIDMDRKGIMLEEEVGYRFSKKIDKPLKDVATLKGYIGAIFPAIEVPIVYFANMTDVTAFDLTAANVGSWKYIIGQDQPLDLSVPNTVNVVLTHDGKEVANKGKGTDILGDQLKALLWIVNNVVKNGNTIEPGYVIISGAMGSMAPAKPGNYVADFGNFGKISFTMVKK